MRLRQLVWISAFLAACFAATAAAALPPAATAGIGWLQTQVNANGTLTNENLSIATPLQARSETANTLFAAATVPAQLTGIITADTGTDTESLSRHIDALVQTGQDPTAVVQTLLANQNPDGGFGDYPGYQSGSFDTAYALQALAVAGQSATGPAHNAAFYLQGAQAANGSWSDWQSADTAYSTALVIEALAPYRTQLTSIATAISAGNAYLASLRLSGSDWGESFVNAQVILALAAGNADATLTSSAAEDLATAQLADGSWGDDPFVTALAVRALQVAQGNPPATQATGSAQGYVVESGTGKPLAGSTVFLASNPQTSTTTNADGFYQFANLPIGQLSLVATDPGYAATSTAATISTGALTKVGQLVLAQNGNTGMVFGLVTSQQNGTPLAGATVQLNGSSQYMATTAGDGGFSFAAVTPGQYTLQIADNGFITVTGAVTVSAGGQLQANQALLLTGTYQNSAPVSVTATLVDARKSVAIPGAQLSLGAGLSATAAADGSVSISSVPMGAYQATVSAGGYVTAVYSVMITPGSNGQLGTLSLYPLTNGTAPTGLTLFGTVLNGLGDFPIGGATVTRLDTGATLTSGVDGSFAIPGLTALTLTLQIAAPGFTTQQFTVNAAGYGTLAQSFVLPASGGSATATSVQLSGIVTDTTTGSPVPNATVALTDGSLQASSGTDGSYQLSGIRSLSFSVQVSAPGYFTQIVPMNLTQFGSYTYSVKLAPTQVVSPLQVLSVSAPSSSLSATDTGVFDASITNRSTSDVPARVFAQVTDSQGRVVAEVGGRTPGSTTPSGTFTVPASGQLAVELDWAPQQIAAGAYTFTVFAATPNSSTYANPNGVVLAQGSTSVSLAPTEAITGQISFSPPLAQAGSQTPVVLSAIIINSGNVLLTAVPMQLTVTDPATGKVIYTASATGAQLPINNNTILNFGSWVPTTSGNLKVHVAPTAAGVSGALDGTLYVGNQATAQITVDRSIVPPGSNTVHAKVAVQGVSLAQAISLSPMLYAMQRAVTNGGAYVAKTAEQFQTTNQCLGCHVQSQSLAGLGSSVGKATISQRDLNYLATALGTGHENSGAIEDSYQGYYDQTQTILGLWGLNKYQDNGHFFGEKLAAAMYLDSRAMKSGAKAYWPRDYINTFDWWNSQDQLTALAVAGLSDLIQTAATSKPSVTSGVVSYSWKVLTPAGFTFQNNDLGVDVKTGPDGRVYVMGRFGTVYWYDPASGATGTYKITGLPDWAFGFTIAPNGDFYISGRFFVSRVPAGTTAAIRLVNMDAIINEVALSPSGVLYGIDQNDSELLRFDTPTPTVVLNRSTLYEPTGLAFDSAGNLMIADTYNYDLIEIARDGTVHQWALGLDQPPQFITSDGQGGWYVASASVSPSGFADPSQIYHFTPDGIGQSLLQATQRYDDGMYGIALVNGVPITVDWWQNWLQEAVTQPVNTATELATLRQDVTNGSNYLLGTYTDGNTSILMQATRLWGLADARQSVTDPTLLNSLNQAVSYLDKLLRSEQKSDGGWSATANAATSQPSDALVTAVVGLALDYSNLSAQDPAIQSAVQFLLNSQNGDGSWSSADGVMATSMASTSLVMDYLPQVLGQLGSLNVGLYVTDTPTASLANYHPAPADTLIGGSGATTYQWNLTGITSEQDVTFDVNLPNMAANETRPIASAAYLQFNNSFTGQPMTLNLTIPQVQAVSGLGVTLATDRPQYPADTPVVISGSVGNNGVPSVNAQVQLQIKAADGTVVATLPAITGLAIATGGQQIYTAQWNTMAYLAGSYTVKASIVDDTGVVASTISTGFAITNSSGGVSGATEAALRTSTDRIIYNTTDTVAIADLAQSVTDNQILSLVHLHVTVTGPSGSIIATYDHDLGQLAPGAIENLPDTLALKAAGQGAYTVSAAMTDSTGTKLASGAANFTVSENLAKTLIGQVAVQSLSVYEGNPQLCTDTAINNGTQPLNAVPLQALVVSIASGTAISTIASSASLAPTQQQQSQQTVDTTPLAVGDYACVLQAQVNGSWKTLGYATFHVTDPTAAFTGTLTANPTQVPLTTAVTLTGGITNGGDATISGITATIAIQDPSGNTVLTSPVSIASLASGQVSPMLATWTAAGNIGDMDTATLIIKVGPKSRALAQTQFTLLPPPIKLAVSQSEPTFNRVLVLLNCMQGDDEGEDDDGHAHQSDCITTRSATLNSLLTSLNVKYLLTTDLPSFMKALRSGRYNQYWVFGHMPESSDEAISAELKEAVNRGDSLLLNGRLDGAGNEDLLEVAGAEFRQALPRHYVGPADLIGPVFTPGSLPTAEGDQELAATGGTVVATFSRTDCHDRDDEGDDQGNDEPGRDRDHRKQAATCTTETVPAVIVNTYGQGHAAVLGLDLLAALQQYPTAAWPATVNSLLQYLQPAIPAAVPPLGYVPVATTVQNQGIATTLSVTDVLPVGATVVDTTPAPSSNAQSQVNWLSPLAVDQTLVFGVGLGAPAVSGNYQLVTKMSTITNGLTTPYGSYPFTFTVRDTGGLEQQLTGELAGVPATSDEQQDRLQHAQAELQEGLSVASKAKWNAAIGELEEVAESLQRFQGTAAANTRLDLDQLIQAFELQWYASGATYVVHHEN